ncbi:polymer-forming cytoskeletal protein [Diaminobutyricimonas sp. TR449]|uniref:polymer-forming cytoskeletal protein n=1 Tax=Diaminobutyricimonas sp. TR449 TaxID=2708076 RepID=UPI00141FA559|nr:polymer-forming cytoskeletal protein [Diaminobutyricimonas sp. TR449]
MMAVTAIIAVTVTTSTVNALGTTSATRASGQARAAAEAGIDTARVNVQSASCASTGVSLSDPGFDYTLFRSDDSHPTATDWDVGCPDATTKYVRVLSNGQAQSRGVAGHDSGDDVQLEAIYAWISNTVPTPSLQPAVFAYQMEGALKNFELTSSSGSIKSDLLIKKGNVLCSNGARIEGDVILGEGYASLDRCVVKGSLHVSGYVIAHHADTVIDGNMTVNGIGVASGANVVALTSGAVVKGNVYAGGNVFVDEKQVQQDVTVAGTSSSVLKVGKKGIISGRAISSGSITAESGGKITGAQSPNTGGLAAVPLPQLPNWTDIDMGYPANTYVGYVTIPWVGDCSVGSSHAFWEGLPVASTLYPNLIVDARACGENGLKITSSSKPIAINGNVAFFAYSYDLDSATVTSATPDLRYLWFNVPDEIHDAQPSCKYPGTITRMNTEFDTASNIAAMVYTPCKIKVDRDNWRGHIYGGTIEFKEQAQMTYVQVGLPGYDLKTGTPLPPPQPPVLGSLVSMRELG